MRALGAGVRVSCEVTPHHFTLTDEACREIAAALTAELDRAGARHKLWVLEELAPRLGLARPPAWADVWGKGKSARAPASVLSREIAQCAAMANSSSWGVSAENAMLSMGRFRGGALPRAFSIAASRDRQVCGCEI